MRVLLTGAAGFIGARVAAALADAGHEVVAVDVMLPAAHGPGAELPADVRRVDVRDAAALAPLLTVSTWCVIRRRSWGLGWTPPTRRPTAATTTSPPRCYSRRCSRRAAGGWCWPRRWWSTGRAATNARNTVSSIRFRAREPTSTAASSSTAARSADSRWGGGWSTRTHPFGRAVCTRRARPRRSTTRWHGRSRPADRWSRCAITMSMGRACRATPRIRGWRPSSAPSSKRATCQGFSKTAGRCGTSFTSTTSPRPTSRPSTRIWMASRRSTCARGGRSRSWRWRPSCARPAAMCCRTSPASTAAATCATSSPTRPAPAEQLGFRAAIDPRDGLREFAYAPLRG